MLKQRGADLVGLCPFHEDREPSLVVTPAKNLWHCFGCGLGGGVIDWVMKADGVSFRHAVELLKDGLPPFATETGMSSTSTPVKRSTVRRLDSPVRLDADDQALLDQVIDYYHTTLQHSSEALSYLASRGIGSIEAIETFKLGYADRTLGLRLPEKNRKAGAALRERLITLGLYRKSGHEHFNGSLIVPIFDEGGHVVEVYGRKRRDDLRPGAPIHLYLPGPHRGVWNVAALATSAEIILCEALMDALTFWVAGYRNVTASYGVQGFTEAHRLAFRQYRVQRVLIAYPLYAIPGMLAALWTPSTSDSTLGALAAGYGATGLAKSAGNFTKWAKSPIGYEKGSTTLPNEKYEPIAHLSPIEKSEQISWLDAMNIFSGNWLETWGSGPTPGASLFLFSGGIAEALLGGDNRQCDCK